VQLLEPREILQRHRAIGGKKYAGDRARVLATEVGKLMNAGVDALELRPLRRLFGQHDHVSRCARSERAGEQRQHQEADSDGLHRDLGSLNKWSNDPR